MSCPEHPQWYHAREDCPFCASRSRDDDDEASERPRVIVAEISKTWVNGEEVSTELGTLARRFEYVIEVNRSRGYYLVNFALHRMMTRPDELNETIIAVFEYEEPGE